MEPREKAEVNKDMFGLICVLMGVILLMVGWGNYQRDKQAHEMELKFDAYRSGVNESN
jgi:uncharacterized membrane protein YidH (DUF202 family)